MILYFSGTGNSRAVAENLATTLGETYVVMTPALRGGKLSLSEGERRIVWVFPVYSWGVPPYVLDIISNVEVCDKKGIINHAVMTCGDDCGLADKMWRKAIRERGWTDGCVMSVQMPNNYVALPGFDVDPKALEEKKLAAYPERVKMVATTLLEAEKSGIQKTEIVRGGMAWIKTRAIYPYFTNHLMNPEKFSVSDACISCGKCGKGCPLGNISMRETDNGKRPEWGKDCAGCLGCYHICPTHAINYTRFTKNKGQYRFHRQKF